MSNNSFRTEYPDFASIEVYIRQAHAERSVYIATAIANSIFAVVRAIGRLASGNPAKHARLPVKASAQPNVARA